MKQETVFWINTSDTNPEYNTEVLIFNEKYIDEDTGGNGVLVGYITEDGEWIFSKWCNYHDDWHTRHFPNEDLDTFKEQLPAPTHWMQKPKNPLEL
jgi:uncharacterized protein DUF551